MTFERQPQFRAVLTCTTCKVVVAVGPPAPREPLAAYALGGGLEGPIHLGTCAGGALDVTIEEAPPDEAIAASSPVRLKVVR